MMAGLKAIAKLTETVNRILDTTSKEELAEKYRNGGIKAKLDVEDAEIYFLIKARDQTPQEIAPEVPE